MEIMSKEYDEYCRDMLTERLAMEDTMQVRVLPYEIIMARLDDSDRDPITGIMFVHGEMSKLCGKDIVLKSSNIVNDRVNTSSNRYWWSYRWLDLEGMTPSDWEVSI